MLTKLIPCLLLIIIICVLSVEAARVIKIPKKALRARKYRPIIISCCGKTKCSKYFSKIRPNADNANGTNSKKDQKNRPNVPMATPPTIIDRVKKPSVGTSRSDLSHFTTGLDSADDEPPESEVTAEVGDQQASAQSTQLLTGATDVTEGQNEIQQGSNEGATISSNSVDSTHNRNVSSSLLPSSNIASESSVARSASGATGGSLTNSPPLGADFSSQGQTTSISQSVGLQSTSTSASSDAPTSTAIETTTVSTTTTTTTTTTTPSPCKDPCLSYQNASQSFNASTMPYPSGNYLMMASKMVYVTVQTMSIFQAIHTCLKLNMVLLSAENETKLASLATALQIKFDKNMEFWTSGANEGEYCDSEKIYSWCSTETRWKKSEVGVKWANSSIEASANERCLSLQLKDGLLGLAYANCAEQKLSVICEPKCSSATCPANCKIDSSLFDSDKNVKDSDKLGYWAKNVCGSTYFFSHSLGTWEQNFQRCCALGLEPIAFETLEELQCISSLTNVNWTRNFNYWTGGTQKGCKGQWAWCAGADALPLPDNLTWTFDQPDNKKGGDDCLHMRLFQNKTGIALSDRNCSDKFIIACEESLFTGTELKDFYSYGKWHSFCGRTILFSSKIATWEKAQNACAEIGTNLLAVEYDDKDACISTYMKKKRALQEIDFWTSGTDAECEGKFSWCALNRKFTNRNMSWSKDAGGDCVSVRFTNYSSFIKTDCSKKLNYICEVRNTGTFGQALQNECMEVWNITVLDMVAFQAAYNASALPKNLKCFVKCAGENLDLFSLGGLAPSEKILRMIEEISAEDEDTLQSGFQAYDECSGKKFEDECETAAEIYQCGREKAPSITSSIYTQSTGNSTLYNPPTPCIPTSFRSCRLTKLPCVVNDTLVAMLNAQNQTDNGFMAFVPSGKKYFIPKRGSTNLDRIMVHNMCCSVGMKMAPVPTRADFEEILPTIIARFNQLDGLMDEIYSNGDGTDSWCGSGDLVNHTIFNAIPGAYQPPVCGTESCSMVHWDYNSGATRPTLRISNDCTLNLQMFAYGLCL